MINLVEIELKKKKEKFGIGDPNMVSLTHVVQGPRKFGLSSRDYTKMRFSL